MLGLWTARAAWPGANSNAQPTNEKLATLYHFFTGSELEGNHPALEDVIALYVIFRKPVILNRRSFHIKFNKDRQTPPSLTNNDSGDESDNDSTSTSLSSLDSLSLSGDTVIPMGDDWSEGDFVPDRPPQSVFNENFQLTNRRGKMRTGIQVPPANANSPVNAWRLVFTNTILEKIVKDTNNYGELHAGEGKWSSVQRKDMTDLFMSFRHMNSETQR
jgi:hypothetical protein